MADPMARGSASQLVIDFEVDGYGADPAPAAGILMPFNYPWDLAGSQGLAGSNTHRNRRDAAMPTAEQMDVKGSPAVPVDRLAMGYWLRALLGAPTTGAPASDALDAAPAVDKVGDYVGLPITGHAFVAGQPVTITGTDNYDGVHTIYSKTANEIVIPAIYVAETFAGTETVVSGVYTHIFKPASALESFLAVSGYTNISQWEKFNGCKLNKMEIEATTKGELLAKLDIVGAKPTLAAVTYMANPTVLALSKFHQKHAAFQLGGVAFTCQSLKFAVNNNLDPDTFEAGLADLGIYRQDLPEGDCEVSGAVKAFFRDETLYNLARNNTESSLQMAFDDGLYSLTFFFPEVFFEFKSPTIVKGGVFVEMNWQAYFEDAVQDAIMVATLVNNRASYA